MAYTRLNLSDGEVFNASHVSHIEDGIEDCETQLSEVNQSLTDFSTLNMVSFVDDDVQVYAKNTAKTGLTVLKIDGTQSNYPSSGSYGAWRYGVTFIFKRTNDEIIIMWVSNASVIATSALSNGAWGSWRTFTGS